MIFLVLIFSCGGIFYFTAISNAYDQHLAHPTLTLEIAKLYNSLNNNLSFALSDQEMQWMRQGAIEEDEPARWINHFYDPVHHIGWSGKHYGYLNQAEGYQRGADIAPKPALPSVEWAINQEYQAAYGRQYGNQTWQKAIASYINGDKKSAFVALGHILHLIEDVSVPDHTRDDSHPGIEGDPGSPYEESSKTYIQNNSVALANQLVGEHAQFKNYSELASAFNEMAIYSNNNFFSEDTINNNDFLLPSMSTLSKRIEVVDGKEKIYLYNANLGAYLAVVMKDSMYSTDDGYFVQPSYRNHLMKKDVLVGASVVKLFFDEVAKYQAHPEELPTIVADSKIPFTTALAQWPKRTVIKTCESVGHVCENIANASTGALAWMKDVGNRITFGLFNTSQTITLAHGNVVTQQADITATVNAMPASLAPPKIVASTLTPTKQQTLPQVLAEKIYAPADAPSAIVAVPIVAAAPSPIVVEPVQTVLAPVTISEPIAAVPTILATPLAQPVPVSTPVYFFAAPDQALLLVPEPVVPPDTTPPPVPLVTVINQTTTTSTNLHVSLSGKDAESPVTLYDVDFTICTDVACSVASTTAWTPWIVASTTSEFDFAGTRGQTYAFRARAQDGNGNISAWSGVTNAAMAFVNWSGEVVVNEVAWAGTSAQYPNDEWFELYNTTDQPIDLSNWKVLVSGQPIIISKTVNSIIPSKGYYLFERSRDETVRNVPADVIYSLSGGFNNKGEKIELLKSNGEKADEVDCTAGWFAGDNVTYLSMERINPLGRGSAAANWRGNEAPRYAGRTYNGGWIFGSPKQANTGFYVLTDRQAVPVKELVARGNPYLLGYYEVATGTILKIGPGIVLKSAYPDSKIDVYGQLEIAGDTANAVTLTSGRDQSLGDALLNSAVGSWTSSTPQAKDWQGIWFHPGSSGSLSNFILRYAGKDFRPSNAGVFTPNVSQAVRVESALVDVTNGTFTNNGVTTVRVESGSATIKNSQFSGGDKAIDAVNSSVAVEGSNFSNFANANGPVQVAHIWPELTNVSFANNVLNLPYLVGVNLTGQGVLSAGSNAYIDALTVAPGGSLTLEPGTTIYMGPYGTWDVNGSLNAMGTQDKPVVFAPLASTSLWGHISFTNSTSSLQYTYITGGNRLPSRPQSLDGMLLLNNSNVTLTNCALHDVRDGNVMQTTNSYVSLVGCSIGQSVRPTFATQGIKISGGALNLDSDTFENVNLGIWGSGSPLPNVTTAGMTQNNFVDVDVIAQPSTLFVVASTTPG